MIWRAGDWPTGRGTAVARRLALWGLAVTVLRQVIFLATNDVSLSATGVGNRYAIAWAGGIALIVVGLVAGSSARARPLIEAPVFAALMALFITGGFVISARLIFPWVAAYREEQRVLGIIRQSFPTLPEGTTLLLDGECPFNGPAVVFSSPWDLGGALWLLYRDSTVRVEVVTPWFKVAAHGIRVHNALYSYNGLIIFDMRWRASHAVVDQAAAEAYFARFNPDGSSGCPRR